MMLNVNASPPLPCGCPIYMLRVEADDGSPISHVTHINTETGAAMRYQTDEHGRVVLADDRFSIKHVARFGVTVLCRHGVVGVDRRRGTR